MKLFAVRDRLLDYYMQPFAAPSDKQVLAALSTTINRGGNNDDIAHRPDQFEVWKIAEVTEDGHVVADRQFIANCTSLVRGRIRPEPEGSHSPGEAQGAENGNHRPPGHMEGPNSPHKPSPEATTRSQGGTTQEIPMGPRRSDYYTIS